MASHEHGGCRGVARKRSIPKRSKPPRTKLQHRFEPLEDRRLLALTNLLTEYVNPLTGEYDTTWNPKQSAYAKIDSTLLQVSLENRFRVFTGDGSDFRPSNSELTLVDQNVVVDAFAAVNGETLSSDILSLGGQVTGMAGKLVSALVPMSAMTQFAELSSLEFATPSYRPVINAGQVQSQGDAALAADLARALGVDGSGIDVGIISDSLNRLGGYPTDLANGEFPVPVTTVIELPPIQGIVPLDEGRALAQIIADIAPGAHSFFNTGVLGIGNFVAAINNLRNAGVDIIVDDLLYLSEPMFQDGAIAQAITASTSAGVAHVSSAGNYSDVGADFGAFVDSGDVGINGGPLHDFDPGPGVDIYQGFTLPVGQSMRISFQWDEPFRAGFGGPGADSPGSASDVDILVVDKTGALAIAGGVSTNVNRNPVEIFSFFNDGTMDFDADGVPDTEFNLAFELYFGPAPGRMKYVDFDGAMIINEYDDSTSTSFGHYSADGVFAVGAVPYTQTPAFGAEEIILNEYSSLGRQEILFDVNGNRLPEPVVRHHPDATGVDQVDTTFFFPGIDIEPNGLPNFPGTSAAAPHVAAVMALMLEAAGGPGSLTVQSLYTGVKNTAIDILKRNVDAPEDIPGGLGYDYFSGHGLVDALAAVNGAMHGFNLVYDTNAVAGDPALNDGDPAGDGVADTFLVALSGDEVVITVNGIEAGRMLYGAISTLTILGSDDDDLLIVDFAGGNPIPAGGMEFDGGNATGTGDRIRYLGGSPAQAIHTFTGLDAGVTEFDGSFLAFTGVELVADLTSPTAREVEMTQSAQFLTFTDGDAAGDGVIRLFSSGTVPSFDFNNAASGTQFLLGDGDDEVTIEALDSLAISPLSFALAGGDDTATVLPQIAAPLSLDGGPQVDSDALFVNALESAVTDTGSEIQFVGLQNIAYADFENVSISNAGSGGGLPDIAVDSVSQAEGSSGIVTDFVFVVTLSVANPNHSVFIDFFTSNGTAEDEFGGGDYFATSGTLEFAPGVTEQTVIVQVQQDDVVEGNEQFFLNLANAINANLLVAQTVGVIINDDFAGVEVVYVNDDWVGLGEGVDPDGAGPAVGIGIDAFADLPEAADAISAGGTILMFAGEYSGALLDKDVSIVAAEPSVVVNGAGTALTIAAGNVSVDGITLDTTADDATLLVSGGALVLRNATVRESDLGAQAAIRVTGGTLDLGTTASAGLNRLRVRDDGLILDNQTATPIFALGNTWLKGGTTLDNFAIEDHVEHALDDAALGLVTWVENHLFVTAFAPAEITATRNNYRRLANMAAVLQEGMTAYLRGTFDFSEVHALADWALGNDGIAATDDDYHVVLPGDIHDVTLTAPALGDATILGPGDVPTVDLEGVFAFAAGDNHNWEFSRLRIFDFDLSIDTTADASNSDARDGLLIADNHISLATDLNFAVAPADFLQNIGIALGPGRHQTIRGNRIDIPGNAVAAGSQFAASVGIQNQPSGPTDFDGLLIENNALHVLNAPAPQPSTIVGIWDVSNAFESNITVRGNSFVNDSPANDPADNLQRAFRIGTQSSASTTVLYENNTVEGANVAFQWQTGLDFSGHQPVELRSNTMSNVFRGITLSSQGSANISDNLITGLGASQGVGIDVQAGSVASIDGDSFGDNEIQGFAKGIFVKGTASIVGNAATISGNEVGIDIDGGSATIVGNRIEGNVTGIRIADDGSASAITNNFIVNNASDGIRITATAGLVGAIFNNSLSGNSNRSIRNQSSELIDASGNWWGVNAPHDVSQEAQGQVDYSPWLDTGNDSDGNPDNGFQGDFTTLHVDDDSPQSGSIGLIQEGVIWALAGGMLILHDGEYEESNTTVDRPLTIVGESREGVVIAPGATDDHTDSAFGGDYQHGFIIQSSDVTIQSLTIDGEANNQLEAGRNNFRNGIVTDRRTGVVYDRTTIEDISVLHVHRRGIEFFSSDAPGSLRSLDNIIRASRIEDVTGRDAILVRESNTLIEDNTIVAAPTGIRASDNGEASNAPLVIIQRNFLGGVGTGILLTGASNGTLVGGVPGEGNVIDLTDGSSADIGILVQYSQGQVAIASNQVLASGGDTAIWLFHNEDATRPIVVVRNELISAGSTSSSVGQGVGIFLTDDGSLRGDEDGASYAAITSNSITGFQVGIHLYQNGSSPAGGRPVEATIGGASTAESNSLLENEVGIRVTETDAAENGGYRAIARIVNNVAGIVGGALGIDVDGGSARLVGNVITENATGVRVQAGGTAFLESNDLRDNTEIGLLIRTGGIVDAGQFGAGVDFTGLGVSTGNNDFSSFTTTADAEHGAIVNLNEDGVAGPQGTPPDVTARNNLFFASGFAEIEQVIYHDADNLQLGFVSYLGLQNLVLTFDAESATEGAEITLNGTFQSAFAGEHDVTIDWGDGQVETITLPAGTLSFSVTHTYLDDNPSGTPSDLYVVGVEIAQADGGGTLTGEANLLVENVAPSASIEGAPSEAEVGALIELTGLFTDAGLEDTHELSWQVLLNGNVVATGSGADFSFTPTEAGTYEVSFTVADDDLGENTATVSIVVNPPASAPGIAQVLLASPSWTGDFLELLGAEGYPLPGGVGQWAVLPWVAMNRVQIVFTEDVIVSAGDLTISGINVASYGIDSFSYDPVTFTATWVLASYISTDLLTFTLSDAVVDADGLALDGDWDNGSSEFPSGDGQPGGDFVFGVRVLPGDIDRFGTVELSDLNYVRNHFGEITTDIFGDVSGNGSIELEDLNVVRNHFGESAVSIPPAPLRASPVNRTAADAVFGGSVARQSLASTATRKLTAGKTSPESIWDQALAELGGEE